MNNTSFSSDRTEDHSNEEGELQGIQRNLEYVIADISEQIMRIEMHETAFAKLQQSARRHLARTTELTESLRESKLILREQTKRSNLLIRRHTHGYSLFDDYERKHMEMVSSFKIEANALFGIQNFAMNYFAVEKECVLKIIDALRKELSNLEDRNIAAGSTRQVMASSEDEMLGHLQESAMGITEASTADGSSPTNGGSDHADEIAGVRNE